MPYLFGSSPPSPEFDLQPKPFIAVARVSCAIGDIEPKLIPAESNRGKIASIGSTSSIFMGFLFEFNLKKSLIAKGFLLLICDE